MYLKHFGLREQPFNLTPDPRFFYDSPLHREAWASLYYGIKEKKGFVVVTGEVGTGKTTLIRKLLRSLEATHRSVFIFNTLLSFDELLESVVRDLDLEPAPGRIAMLEQVNDFLVAEVGKGHTVSVLIDEAQNLDEDALEAVRLLSNLETDREKLLQIILSGQPELEAKLNSRELRQLKQRVSLWCRLDRLSQADTAAYIAHRLAVAGYQGPELFSKAALQLIWERTGGIPRLINAICDNALVTAFATSLKTVTPDVIHEAARDLRLTPEAGNGSLEVEGSKREQLARRNPGTPVEMPDNSGVGRSRRAEEPERPRFARAAGEVFQNLGLKQEPAARDAPVAEVMEARRPSPKMAAVAELKEVKGRPSEKEENPWVVPERSIARRGTVEPKEDYRVDEMVVPRGFFDGLIAALTDAMGPMANLVLAEQVAALGESSERFPIARLADLLQGLKSEILSDPLRAAFESRIRKQIQEYTRPARKLGKQ
ncbi:MAG TPA: AAA family ATPase [candidate division Zixibacteria bacterium]|nr:AAA family ATPase [candidate division Zixibacteria bacterium]